MSKVLGLVFLTALLAPDAAPEEFAGSTPCGPIVRQFLGIPASASCERVTWQLRFDGSRFAIEATFGMQAVNDPGFAPGAGTTRRAGTWSKTGPLASYLTSEIRRLTAGDGRSMDAALLDGALLHPLNARGDLLRGDAGWSYTLTLDGEPASRHARVMHPLTAPRADAAGDFEGRTACVEVSRLLQLEPATDCAKLKWGVTFLADGTYKIEGTLYRAAPRTGRWGLRLDRATGALIYVLDPERPASLALLKAGPDVLFFLDADGAMLGGNASHSYTLNRSSK